MSQPLFTVATDSHGTVRRIHVCLQEPAGAAIECQRGVPDKWYVELGEELISSIKFCPYCGVELPRINFEKFEKIAI